MRSRLSRPARWPLRVRLTAWYVLLLGLTLTLFSGYVYVRQERSLLDQTDAGLRAAAAQVLTNLDVASGRPALRRTDAAAAMVRRLTEAGFAVRLLAPDGGVAEGFGASGTVPARVPSAPGYTTLPEDEIDWRLYSQRIEGADGAVAGWVQVAQSLTAAEEALESLYRQMVVGLPLVLALAGLGGFFFADRALRPIAGITRTAGGIGADDLTRRIGYRGPADEVGQLALTFDRMLDRLAAAFARERRFTADAAHELRTPLTAIKGRIGVTRSRPRTAAEYERALDEVERQVDRLIRLSTDLLFLARLDQARARTQAERVDLGALLEAIVEQLRPLAEDRGITLHEDIPPGLAVVGDFDHLTRLFLNLLDNALKYTPPAGRVAVRARGEGADIRVTIRDTGSGIAPEHLPRIFDRFYRAEAARSRDDGGAGLGLAIAFEIARAHGGTLSVESGPGEGATFTVALPGQRPMPGPSIASTA